MPRATTSRTAPQIIDINMGCPAKKVCNVAAGSALLRDEALVAAILRAVVAAVDVPVTLKIRTGWSPDRRNALAVARLAEDAGIAALAVHGRTRACGFVGPAEYDTIRAVKAAVAIPVIANGDIATPAEARSVLAHTGADALMIGRAAQGRPWIFREIRHFLDHGAELPPPTVAEARALILEHLDDHYGFYGERGRRARRAQAPRLVRQGTLRRRAAAAGGQRRPDDRRAAGRRQSFFRLPRRARPAPRLPAGDGSRRRRAHLVRRTRAIATGRGGPGRVRKTLRISGSNEIGKSVEKSLDDYFLRLDGEPPHGIYDMVITHVERAMISSVMERAGGNQTQAADMLGLNRSTLRSKLTKYGIR